MKSRLFQHFIAVLSAVSSKSSMLLITVINSYKLSPDEFGVFAVLMVMVGIINNLVGCGGDMWLNQFTLATHSRQGKAPDVSRFYAQISGVIGAGVLLVAFLYGTILYAWIFPEHRVVITLALIFGVIGGVGEMLLAIIRTTNRVSRFFLIRDVMMPGLLIAMILGFHIDDVRDFFLAATILWLALLTSLLAMMMGRADLFFPQSVLKWQQVGAQVRRHTMGFIANNITSRLANSLDVFVLSSFLSIATVGQYRLAAQLANGFIVVQHFAFLALPWHFHQNQTVGADGREIRVRQGLLLLTALPALLVLIWGAEFFLSFLGQDLSGMVAVFSALMILRFSDLLWGPQHQTLVANNLVFSDVVANACGLVAWGVGFFVGQLFLDMISAAVYAGIAASLVVQSVRYFMIKKNNLTYHNVFGLWAPILVAGLAGLGFWVWY